MHSKSSKTCLLFYYKQNCLIGYHICSFCDTHVKPFECISFGYWMDGNVYSVLDISDDQTSFMHFGIIISDQYFILYSVQILFSHH